MASEKDYLNKMKALLKELIEVATELRDASLQALSETEMEQLQNRQEELIKQLEQVDNDMHGELGSDGGKSIQQELHNQLAAFQKLNQEFVDNLNASHGLIQFELRRLEDEQDFSLLRHLKPAKEKNISRPQKKS